MPMANIEKREITTELKESYLDYAMSVIVSRALPDVRDGLKPVQRRILWAMWDGGITAQAKFRKSAYVVGECFVKNTLVSTKRGLIPIQNIQVGDEIFTQTNRQTVKQLFKMPPRNLLKITLGGGFYNIVTPSQKFKVLMPDLSFKWKEARHLTENDYLILRSVYPETKDLVNLGTFENGRTIYLNEDIAYLLGLFVSDGWITNDYGRKKHPRIGFTAGNKKVLEKVKSILENEFNYSPTIEIKKYRLPTKNGQLLNKEIFTLRINSKAVNEFLASQFDLEDKWALTKEIPSQIFQSPPSVISAFVSGLIEGDGYISKKRNLIKYVSISEKLVDQLMLLLFSQGIFSNKYKNNNLYKKERFLLGKKIINQHLSYAVDIQGENALKLAAKLNLFDDYKNSKVSRLKFAKIGSHERKGFNTYDVIPYASGVLFKELSEAHLSGGWYEDHEGNKFRMGIKYPGGAKIRYSSDLDEKPLRTSQIIEWGIKRKLEKINSPFFNFIDSVIKNNLRFIKISSIEDHPPEETYDLEVGGDHEFVANGMIVHNCMGKYHPHGDMAIYDTLVRMAQDFSLRYPLIQGQGNWGSVDGDGAAAQRYTEARLSKISEELLFDIEKETVDWQPNYDGTRQEPKVLPAKLPNLLLNGGMGIAVGMATSIPPHNLGEVIDATLHLIDHPKAGAADLLGFIQGPDFPTGGIIYDKKAIAEAYTSGRGPITTRAVAEIQERRGSKEAYDIVITEIPYQVNKAELIIKIAELVQDKKIEGIHDVRDESDKEGLRIVIELKSTAAPQKVLNQLYNHTDLQKDFHLNMIALVQGLQPQVLSLKDILQAYVEHREIVVRRRTEFDLKRARERAHILEGLSKALAVIDKIISTIKKSADRDEAQKNLIKNFKLTEIQANAILEMRLQTLAALERQKIEDELKEKKKLIAALEILLKSREKILGVIKDELTEIKNKYNDERRTKVIAHGLKEFREEDLIPQEETVITFSESGYIKRLPPGSFRIQKRGGKGLIGSEVAEEDFLTHLISANTHDNILFFTDRGRVFQTKVWEIPSASRTSKGKPVHNFLEVPQTEKVNAIVSYPEGDKVSPYGRSPEGRQSADSKSRNIDISSGRYLVMLTKNGMIKKTGLGDFGNVRRTGIIAIRLKKGDLLRWVKMSSGSDEVIITTHNGQSIRFKESQVRAMGRAAAGVKAIRLKKNDEVSSMDIIKISNIKDQRLKIKDQRLLVVMANGFGKQTPIAQYRLQRRGGSGIKTAKITSKTGMLVAAHVVDQEEEMIALSAKGQIIRTKLAQVRLAGRATQGVKVMTLNPGDKVAGVICL